MLPFYKYLAWHRNEGLKEVGNFHLRLSSTSLSIPSALLKIIPNEQLLRVQVPNCGLILESKSRAFINDISTTQASCWHVPNQLETYGGNALPGGPQWLSGKSVWLRLTMF